MIKMKMTITLHCWNLPKPTRGGKKKEPNGNGKKALQRARGNKKEGGSKLEVGERGGGGGGGGGKV